MTNWKHVSTITILMATKHGEMVAYNVELPQVSCTTLWSLGLVESHDRLKPIYPNYHNACDHETCQDGDFLLEAASHKVMQYLKCMVF